MARAAAAFSSASVRVASTRPRPPTASTTRCSSAGSRRNRPAFRFRMKAGGLAAVLRSGSGMVMLRRSWLIVGLVSAGCSMPSYVRTAYYGDLPSLKKEISSAAQSGRISRADVVDLAQAIARRELRSARGDDVIARILAVRSCARAVEPELRERAEAADDAGAGATLVLVDEIGRASW